MDIDRVLASNFTLGTVLVLVLVAIGRANRGFVRDIARDPERFWRTIARIALVTSAMLIAWTSIFDNWRQLIGLPYRLSQRFPSQRVEYDPPPDNVRAVTFVLLGLSLIAVACLVARHVGGYPIQMIFLVGAIIFWAPLFAVRLRVNVNLAFGFEGSATAPLDVIGYVLFVLLAWLFEVTMILISYSALLGAVALPVTLLLDLARLRRPRITTEAAAFFSSLSDRAGSPGHHG